MELHKQKRVLWDSCICIDFMEMYFNGDNFIIKDEDADYFNAIYEIWKKYERNQIEIWVSALAMVESVKLTGVMPEEQIKIVNEFFSYLRGNFIAIGFDVAEKAHKIRALQQIKLCQYDSIYLGAAQQVNIPIVITRDNKAPNPFLSVNNKHKTDNGQSIKILKPEDYIQLIDKELY